MNMPIKEKKTSVIAKFIILSLVIALSIIILKDQFAYNLMKNSNRGMEPLMERKTIENLYIGSSMFRQGLDPNVLFDYYNSDNYYILSYNGNDPVLTLFELSHLINNNVKVQNLYVDMYVYSTLGSPQLQDEKLLLDISIKDKYELFRIISVDKSIPEKASYFWRIFITSNNELIFTWLLDQNIISNQFKNGGSTTIAPGQTTNSLISYGVPIVDGSMNSIQHKAILGIIDLCHRNDINLIFIETPKYITIHTNKQYNQILSDYCDILNANHIPSIIYKRDYDFDSSNPEYYSDSIHLSSKGKKVFTDILVNLSSL